MQLLFNAIEQGSYTTLLLDLVIRLQVLSHGELAAMRPRDAFALHELAINEHIRQADERKKNLNPDKSGTPQPAALTALDFADVA